jgi:hypothetical protein
MSNLIETTRWRADRAGAEQAAAPIDPEAARELAAAKLEQRAALAVDRQNAMVEYEANRLALIANTERLKSLRLARDAAAALEPKGDEKKPTAKAARSRKAPAKPTS